MDRELLRRQPMQRAHREVVGADTLRQDTRRAYRDTGAWNYFYIHLARLTWTGHLLIRFWVVSSLFLCWRKHPGFRIARHNFFGSLVYSPLP